MKKGDLIVLLRFEGLNPLTGLELGKIYELETPNKLKNIDNLEYFNAYPIINSGQASLISKDTYKILTRAHAKEDVETIFKDLINFKEKYIQDYLKDNSLGLIEHLDKIGKSIVPYSIDKYDLNKDELSKVLNLIVGLDSLNFGIIYDKEIERRIEENIKKIEQEELNRESFNCSFGDI